jgi:[ribosomal protein S5]-alanine N-acetyltransferase
MRDYKPDVLFSSFPTFKSERCYYNQITNDQINDIYALRSNVQWMEFVPREPMISLDQAYTFVDDTQGYRDRKEGTLWGMFLHGSDRMIAMIGIYRIRHEHHRGEIGYMLNGEYHNQGLITEAVDTVTAFAFDKVGFHSLEAVINPRNKPSERVLIKSGWVKEAHFKENFLWKGVYEDSVIYSKINPNLYHS